jgi:hypothetical protein
MSNNLLSGHLPSTLSCLSGIEVLNIAHNQLTGELPELVCDLRRITNLSVGFNFFSEISQDCYRLAGRSMFAQANDLHVKELNMIYLIVAGFIFYI